jgi:WhiB family redox-sensing transcriptional regulator
MLGNGNRRKQVVEKLASPDESGEQGLADAIRRVGRVSLEWQLLAICRGVDPDLFYPDKGQSPEPAKRVCMKCEVRDSCLEFAMVTGERFGVWGGLSARERNKLRKRAV